MTARGRCHTGDHRAPDGGGSCDCGTVTVIPARKPVDEGAIEHLTTAANNRRLAWFTDAELRAEIQRRAQTPTDDRSQA